MFLAVGVAKVVVEKMGKMVAVEGRQQRNSVLQCRAKCFCMIIPR
jgi:hypothetical protein